jgi:hypothetical protein
MTTAPMSCERFEALLGDLLEDALEDSARDACARHRDACAACAALLAELEGLRVAAAQLPPPTPSHDLWSSIEARLETPVVPRGQGHPASRAALPWRRLAAAAVVLVTVSAGATWMMARREPAGAPATQLVAVGHAPTVALDTLYGREIALLRTAAEGTLGQLDPATAEVVRRNLTIIDQAILESRAALAADPQSGFLLEQLDRAYGQKVSLLRRLTLL